MIRWFFYNRQITWVNSGLGNDLRHYSKNCFIAVMLLADATHNNIACVLYNTSGDLHRWHIFEPTEDSHIGFGKATTLLYVQVVLSERDELTRIERELSF